VEVWYDYILHMWSAYKAWIVVQFIIYTYQCIIGVVRHRRKCTKNDVHGALRVIATFVEQTLMTICFPHIIYTRARGCRLIRRSRTLYIVYINIYYIIYILNSYVLWPLFSYSYNNKLIRHRFSGCARRYIMYYIAYSIQYVFRYKLGHDLFVIALQVYNIILCDETARTQKIGGATSSPITLKLKKKKPLDPGKKWKLYIYP